MHESVYREMGKFASSLSDVPLLIADVGSMDVNGSYRPLFSKPKWSYTGFDIAAGKNVDVVLDGHYEWKNVNTLFDVVISGSTLEHTKYPWLIMDQMSRILRPGGRMCVTAPYCWGYHAHPIDCWRIYPDGMRAIMERSGLTVDQVYMVADDHNKQCGDTIAVARKLKPV